MIYRDHFQNYKGYGIPKAQLIIAAKQGDKILDTHLGSQSSRIAAHKAGFDFTGFETDEDYFREGNKRFDNHVKQLTLL